MGCLSRKWKRGLQVKATLNSSFLLLPPCYDISLICPHSASFALQSLLPHSRFASPFAKLISRPGTAGSQSTPRGLSDSTSRTGPSILHSRSSHCIPPANAPRKCWSQRGRHRLLIRFPWRQLRWASLWSARLCCGLQGCVWMCEKFPVNALILMLQCKRLLSSRI